MNIDFWLAQEDMKKWESPEDIYERQLEKEQEEREYEEYVDRMYEEQRLMELEKENE